MQRSRAEAAGETRARILAAARELLPAGSALRVGEIAARAGVSVQTLYTHFGSKSGLLMASVTDVEREAGLEAGFERVWSSPTAETALREMVAGTFRFWHRAWPYVEFTVRARRTDPVVREQVGRLDASRHAHLVSLCGQLQGGGRLRSDLSPERAADLAFALTTPTVYEELVVLRGWSLPNAMGEVAESVLGALLAPATGTG